MPRLEALVEQERPDLSSMKKGQSVRGYQLLVGWLLLALYAALTPSNVVALLLALLGFAFAYPEAPTWQFGVLLIVLVAALSAYQRRFEHNRPSDPPVHPGL